MSSQDGSRSPNESCTGKIGTYKNISTIMDTYAHLQPNMQKNAVAKFKKHMKKKAGLWQEL